MRTRLNKNEKTLLILHQHWLVLLRPTLSALIVIVFSILWFWAFSGSVGITQIDHLTEIAHAATGHHYLRWLGIVFFLWSVFLFIWRILVRKYNLWVITNQRIIDEFGVLTTNSKESPLDKINNVSYHQSLWGRLFGFGDVSIQTAAEMGDTVYLSLAHPKLVKSTISTARGHFSKTFFREEGKAFANAVNQKENNNTQPDFAQKLTELHQLKTQGILTEEEYNAQKQKLMDNS